MSTRIWLIPVAIVVVIAIVLGSMFIPTLSGTPHSNSGTMAVAVHDAPCTNCSHVWVTFQSVAVHEANATNATDGGWMALNVSATTVDLMALNGSALAKVIGVGSLSAGHYEMIRLNVSNVVVGLQNGTNVTATVTGPTADVHGWFAIQASATTTVSIDIDLASSLHVTTIGGTVVATFTPDIGNVTASTS